MALNTAPDGTMTYSRFWFPL